ncbi:MAG: hypothetical protein LBK95_20475 [Bifidobacteriaceae bacterium]|jgi:hypothetical protein|nr:hypothetical protein [Bifidobacteriaceae bacterium]
MLGGDDLPFTGGNSAMQLLNGSFTLIALGTAMTAPLATPTPHCPTRGIGVVSFHDLYDCGH